MLDTMLYHSGGVNRTGTARRAVNHLYSIPLIRQQIDLPGRRKSLVSDCSLVSVVKLCSEIGRHDNIRVFLSANP